LLSAVILLWALLAAAFTVASRRIGPEAFGRGTEDLTLSSP
jgi:hypothetical protein